MSKSATLESRAIAVIARYERAAGELGRIKKGIVAELEKCPVTIEAYASSSIGSPGLSSQSVSQKDFDRLWDGSRVRHHLHEALQVTTESDFEYGSDRKLNGDEIRAELEGMGYDDDQPHACPHCLAAWLLIERRKEVRREFGIAKRTLRALGKSALKAAQ
jgi:hypothetical protein